MDSLGLAGTGRITGLRGACFLLILLGLSTTLTGQPDSTRMPIGEFMSIVLRNHPVVRQADFQEAIAEAERLAGRAGFDPSISATWQEKYYDGKHYYRYAEGKLRVPTWLGIELAAGYQNNTGTFLNPEARNGSNGLWAAGVEANLLQGLLTDERRTARNQAAVFADMALNERTRLLNDILLEAFQAYAEWQAAETVVRIIDENLVRAETYYSATTESWRQGAKPAVDTLEAYLIVQDQLVARQEADRDRVKARQRIESFLWLQDLPAELQPGISPEAPDTGAVPLPSMEEVASLAETHPEVTGKLLSLRQYELDLRLKQQKLLPKLKVKYYPLLTPVAGEFLPGFNLADYQWGVDLSMPLTFRQARADARIADAKVQQADLEWQDKRNVRINKAIAARLEVDLVARQVAIEEARVENYRRLLEAEQERFSIGESSVFLLNKRQESYFEARVKWTRLKAKYLQAVAGLLHETNLIVGYAGVVSGSN